MQVCIRIKIVITVPLLYLALFAVNLTVFVYIAFKQVSAEAAGAEAAVFDRQCTVQVRLIVSQHFIVQVIAGNIAVVVRFVRIVLFDIVYLKH